MVYLQVTYYSLVNFKLQTQTVNILIVSHYYNKRIEQQALDYHRSNNYLRCQSEKQGFI